MRFAALVAFITLLAIPAYAEDVAFTLENTSSAVLVELFASPHSADSWGENILGDQTLNSGESGTVSIADGEATCDYDLRFVMDSGATLEGTQNLCELATYTLTD
jgi:hypothetical protein